MKAPADAPRVGDYLLIVARGWVVVVVATALSVGVGWLAWQFGERDYTSSSKVMITTPTGATTFDAFYGLLNSRSRITTYETLVHGNQVTSRTIQQLGLTDTPDELAGRVVIPPSSSPVLDVMVRGKDPAQTQAIAQAVTDNLIALSGQMAKVDTAATGLVQVDPAGPAQRVGSATQSMTVAGGLGLLLSVVFVIGSALLRGRVLGRRQLARVVEQAGHTEAAPA